MSSAPSQEWRARGALCASSPLAAKHPRATIDNSHCSSEFEGMGETHHQCPVRWEAGLVPNARRSATKVGLANARKSRPAASAD